MEQNQNQNQNMINIAQALSKIAYEENLANELRKRNELINLANSNELLKRILSGNNQQSRVEPTPDMLRNSNSFNPTLNIGSNQALNVLNMYNTLLKTKQAGEADQNRMLIEQLTRNMEANLTRTSPSPINMQDILKFQELSRAAQNQGENMFLHEKTNRANDFDEDIVLARTRDVSRIQSNNQVLNTEDPPMLIQAGRSKFSISLKDVCKKEEHDESPPQEDYGCKSEEHDDEKGDNRGDKMKFYKCTFRDCDKVFPKECNLKDHIRTHTGEKPFQCNFPGCDKSFSQQGNLKKHEKVHIGEKKFTCEFPGCGKKFSIHNRSHLGDKPYVCNFENCGRAFYDKGNLKYHEKSAHFSESISFPYSCEHMSCNMKFKTKKQKLIHHNKMEVECKAERNSLVQLIKKFKQLLQHVDSIGAVDLSGLESYSSLKTVYKETERKLLDPDYFHCMLGKNFEDNCAEEDDDEEQEKTVG